MKAEDLKLPPKNYTLLQAWADAETPGTFAHAFHTALAEIEDSPQGNLTAHYNEAIRLPKRPPLFASPSMGTTKAPPKIGP